MASNLWAIFAIFAILAVMCVSFRRICVRQTSTRHKLWQDGKALAFVWKEICIDLPSFICFFFHSLVSICQLANKNGLWQLFDDYLEKELKWVTISKLAQVVISWRKLLRVKENHHQLQKQPSGQDVVEVVTSWRQVWQRLPWRGICVVPLLLWSSFAPLVETRRHVGHIQELTTLGQHDNSALVK